MAMSSGIVGEWTISRRVRFGSARSTLTYSAPSTSSWWRRRCAVTWMADSALLSSWASSASSRLRTASSLCAEQLHRKRVGVFVARAAVVRSRISDVAVPVSVSSAWASSAVHVRGSVLATQNVPSTTVGVGDRATGPRTQAHRGDRRLRLVRGPRLASSTSNVGGGGHDVLAERLLDGVDRSAASTSPCRKALPERSGARRPARTSAHASRACGELRRSNVVSSSESSRPVACRDRVQALGTGDLSSGEVGRTRHGRTWRAPFPGRAGCCRLHRHRPSVAPGRITRRAIARSICTSTCCVWHADLGELSYIGQTARCVCSLPRQRATACGSCRCSSPRVMGDGDDSDHRQGRRDPGAGCRGGCAADVFDRDALVAARHGGPGRRHPSAAPTSRMTPPIRRGGAVPTRRSARSAPTTSWPRRRAAATGSSCRASCGCRPPMAPSSVSTSSAGQLRGDGSCCATGSNRPPPDAPPPPPRIGRTAQATLAAWALDPGTYEVTDDGTTLVADAEP